jgi:hypothetical protein
LNAANPRRPKPDRRRALAMLAGCPDGCNEAIMTAHGFGAAVLAALVRDGLVEIEEQRVGGGGRVLSVKRFTITEAGRRAIESTG